MSISKKAKAVRVGDLIAEDYEFVSYSRLVVEVKHRLGMVFIGTVDGEGFNGGWHWPDVRFAVVASKRDVVTA